MMSSHHNIKNCNPKKILNLEYHKLFDQQQNLLWWVKGKRQLNIYQLRRSPVPIILLQKDKKLYRVDYCHDGWNSNPAYFNIFDYNFFDKFN